MALSPDERVRVNPGMTAVLSFFFSGLGQIYNGEIRKGLKITPGMNEITPTSTSPVAVPVRSHAQSVIAKPLIRLAKIETNCPVHST